MSEETIEETEPVFEPFESTLGVVIGIEDGVYLIATPRGKVIGVRANGDATSENVEADIASPAADPVDVPKEVTRRQLFLALLSVSSSLTRAAIRGSLSGNEAALIEFDEAISFRRDHFFVASLAASLELTNEEVDGIFIAAAAL